MMNIVSAFILFTGTSYSGSRIAWSADQEPQQPVVNDNPDSNIAANNDNKVWFNYQDVENTLHDPILLIMGIVGFAVLFVAFCTCIIHECKKRKRHSGYSKQEVIEDESDEGVGDIEMNIEQEPFHDK